MAGLDQLKAGHDGESLDNEVWYKSWGEDHFDRMSKPCSRKILVAVCEVI